MSGVGVRVSREGPGLSLPTSLTGTTGSVSGDNIDWVDGGGAPGSVPSTGMPVEVKDEGVSLDTAVTSLDFVGAGVTATHTGHAVTVTIPGSSGTLTWFNVKDYGATGDGTTDDTAAINLAIAALNTATRGVLYFPAGTYKCSSALTAITASGTIMGDGMTGDYTGATLNPSVIVCSSGTATFLTVAAGTTVRDLALRNTAGSVTAGYGIGGTNMNLVRFERVSVTGFWINFDIDGGLWTASRCYSRQSHKYGFDVSYAASPDGGDWNITDCYIVDGANSSDAGVHITSGGGGKIANTKINSDNVSGFLNGINMSIVSGVVTVDLQLANCSIENIRGDGVFLETTGTGQFGFVTITGMEIALFGNNTGRAVKISAAATGGLGTNGGFSEVVIDGCVFYTSGTARAAIELTKTNNVTLGDIVISGFNARYTSSGDTNTTDGASISFATPAIVLGTAAAAGAATTVIRSDSTIVAFDATAPTTSAVGDSAATGSAAKAARRDHVHGREALSTATPLVESGSGAVGTGVKSSREDHVHPASAGGGSAHYLVVASSHSTPLIFGDLVQASAGDDLIYTT